VNTATTALEVDSYNLFHY